MHDKSWQAFVERIAYQSEAHEQEYVGRVLWTLVWCVLATIAAGLFFQWIGWLK